MVKILLVEGINDAKVVEALCKKSGIKGVHILPLKDKEGTNLDPIESYKEKKQELNGAEKSFHFAIYLAGSDKKLVEMIVPLLKSESIHTLAFILDADKQKGKDNDLNIKSRLDQIANKFIAYRKNYGKKFNKINSDGLIIPQEEELPRIGLWLMPNNTDKGMLEDFLMEMINFTDNDGACIKLAKDCVTRAVNEDCTSFRKPHFSKAVIHTYLSWQDEPGDALALSITRGNLNANSPIAIKFLTWLTKVFEIDTNSTMSH